MRQPGRSPARVHVPTFAGASLPGKDLRAAPRPDRHAYGGAGAEICGPLIDRAVGRIVGNDPQASAEGKGSAARALRGRLNPLQLADGTEGGEEVLPGDR